MILQGKAVKKHFPIHKGVFLQVAGHVKALESVDFEIGEKSTLGIVGESGCGKTTLGKVISRIHPMSAGELEYMDSDGNVHAMHQRIGKKVLRKFQRDVQMIFQDPYNSLDPRMTISRIISEPLKVHGLYKDKEERDEYIAWLLERVGLYPEYGDRYPHEFSGGQRQRISIARAIALKPRLIICDEPTSALDVSVQSQVINLLDELKEEFNLSYLFISHDLDVVHHVSDRIMVMYLGSVMEEGSAEDIINNPVHPYTKMLMESIPGRNPKGQKEFSAMEGEPPSPINPPPGCPFSTRCPKVMDKCKQVMPEVTEMEGNHRVRCFLYGDKE